MNKNTKYGVTGQRIKHETPTMSNIMKHCIYLWEKREVNIDEIWEDTNIYKACSFENFYLEKQVECKSDAVSLLNAVAAGC